MRKKIKLAHPCSCSFRTWQFPSRRKKNLAPCLVDNTFDCAVYPVYILFPAPPNWCSPKKESVGWYYVIILIRDFHLQGTVNNDIRRPAAAASQQTVCCRYIANWGYFICCCSQLKLINQPNKKQQKILGRWVCTRPEILCIYICRVCHPP